MPNYNVEPERGDAPKKFKKWPMVWAHEPMKPRKPMGLDPLQRMEVERAKIGKGEGAGEEIRRRLLRRGPKLRRGKRRLKYDPSREEQN